MIQLRYLRSAELQKASTSKRNNGTVAVTNTKIADYQVQIEEMTDGVSASLYGATINRIHRINTPQNKLEKLLLSKMNNSSDNVSLYTLLINDNRYKIVTVRERWIDIELI